MSTRPIALDVENQTRHNLGLSARLDGQRLVITVRDMDAAQDAPAPRDSMITIPQVLEVTSWPEGVLPSQALESAAQRRARGF